MSKLKSLTNFNEKGINQSKSKSSFSSFYKESVHTQRHLTYVKLNWWDVKIYSYGHRAAHFSKNPHLKNNSRGRSMKLSSNLQSSKSTRLLCIASLLTELLRPRQDSPSLLYVVSTAFERICGNCLRICPDSDLPDCGLVKFYSAECCATFPRDLCSVLGPLKKTEFDSEEENQARFLLAAYHLQLVSPEEFEKLLLLEGEGKVDDEGVEERSVRGYGLHTTAAFINLECLPNCCRFEYVDKPGKSNTGIYIRVMHDILPEPEICTRYFPVN
ncbi:hypothetical protein R1flu_007892 [Riccia fluitans]|uniref:SET domain-containing protein n=1 Tax=Riccia fluitans TaxID=41844 RepID=A0ABD1Z0Z9_9MARC